jgi:methyl-accepting chemotaxis protein
MISIIQNLRIGTKLAVTSALTILLVAGMIYLQITGGMQVREASETASRQQGVAANAGEAKASVRGMQLGTRDIVLAKNPAELQAAVEYFNTRKASTLRYLGELTKLSTSAENRQRMAKLTELTEAFDKGKDQFLAVRKQLIDIESKLAGKEASAETAAQLSKLAADIVRIRNEVTIPISREMEATANTIAEHGNKRSVEARAVASATEVSVERTSIIAGVAVALLLIATCIFSVFTIARPMRALSASMEELAGGNFDVVLPGLGRKDEVGDVAGAVEKFKVVSAEKAQAEAEAKINQDKQAAEQRKKDMIKLADDFEGAVGEIIETVSSASTELEASAGTLTSTAERAQELTTMVAAASEEASTNVQSVASATEELSSSVNEISRQVQESARMASDAVNQARTTNDRVSELSKAASRIGDVVELINTIAGQTNLLALNATIEAARAGEAGRGFAVVASEVKALAEQTAKATGEIGQQITGIQAATQESVSAIKEISGTIERLSEISSTIAAAVEEQGAATQEISRNVQQAAQGTQQVSSNIMDVQRGASETGSASSQVLSAAQSLSGDSNRLKLEVGKFLNTVRAA